MKKTFQTRLEAIEWMAEQATNEGQFEVWREQFNFNFIYTGRYFIDTKVSDAEVDLLKDKPQG